MYICLYVCFSVNLYRSLSLSISLYLSLSLFISLYLCLHLLEISVASLGSLKRATEAGNDGSTFLQVSMFVCSMLYALCSRREHIYTPIYTHIHLFTPIYTYLHPYTPIHLYTYTPIHLYTYTPTVARRRGHEGRTARWLVCIIIIGVVCSICVYV
jgi:hypothetical protein